MPRNRIDGGYFRRIMRVFKKPNKSFIRSRKNWVKKRWKTKGQTARNPAWMISVGQVFPSSQNSGYSWISKYYYFHSVSKLASNSKSWIPSEYFFMNLILRLRERFLSFSSKSSAALKDGLVVVQRSFKALVSVDELIVMISKLIGGNWKTPGASFIQFAKFG